MGHISATTSERSLASRFEKLRVEWGKVVWELPHKRNQIQVFADFAGRTLMSKLPRRIFLGLGMAATFAGPLGCLSRQRFLNGSKPDLVWGRRGLSDGRFLKPRAIAIDANDNLYIVDTTGRIQVFDVDGKFLRGWKTPEAEFGRPTGMFVDQQQRLLVADTHYHRVLVYELDGNWLREQTIGGVTGTTPGSFAFVTDVVRDSKGNFYVGDYGDADRIQKFSPSGDFIAQWGGNGQQPGELVRPQSLAIDDRDQLWVADACNHRIQVFDSQTDRPTLIDLWGQYGPGPGELSYPYGIAFGKDGNVWVCEYGNQRIQQFTRRGESLGTWGSPGRGEGELYQPWGLVVDRRGRLHVLDSNNHRVQRVVVPS
jgi:DNA-binding beta-propeller fold protein YncE